MVNGAIPEVSQAVMHGPGDVQAGQLQAVAIRLWVFEQRAHAVGSVSIRFPCRDARHK